MSTAKQHDLHLIRQRIDSLDAGMLRLLSERAELALRAGKIKALPLDSEREVAVFRNVEKCRRGPLSSEFLQALFCEIIQACRMFQEEQHSLVAYQGERGANSEEAARAACPESVPIPFPTFRDVFDAVTESRVDLGILPVENSTEGAVTEVNDLLLEYDLFIVREISLPVHHQLLVPPGSGLSGLRTVYSHPQALAQCRTFLREHALRPHPMYDTAGAARRLSDEPGVGFGVIAARSCSFIYNLDIAAENIEDDPSNRTRFLVVSREETTEEALKSSLICSTPNEPGALWELLGVFRDRNINITRIESRPMKTRPGSYVFFIDFVGSPMDPVVTASLAAVREHSVFLKFLGGYPTKML